MAPGKAPVDAVGGTQNEGPWPKSVDEIVEGNSYKRPVELADGSVQELTVDVTKIVELPRGGYAVSFQFDDPTL